MFERSILSFLIVATFLVETAIAQDRSTGISVAYGEGISIGIRSGISSEIVLRPAVAVYYFKYDEDQSTGTSSSYSIVMDVLFVRTKDQKTSLQTYLGGGISFAYNEIKNE